MSCITEIFPDWASYKKHCVDSSALFNITADEFYQRFAAPPEELCALPGYPEDGNLFAQVDEAIAPKQCGCCTVHNLLNEPGILIDKSAVYVGRANPKQQLRASPLANIFRMKGDSKRERNRVCDADIPRLIRMLELKASPAWKEINRLVRLVRKGEAVKLMCYCAPLRCHGDAIALVITRLAHRVPTKKIIEELRALLPAKQTQILRA